MLFEKYAGQSEQWWNFRWLPYSLTIQRTELIRGAYEQVYSCYMETEFSPFPRMAALARMCGRRQRRVCRI